MITPETVTLFDVSDNWGDDEVSLNRIASEFYGREYKDMYGFNGQAGNDTSHIFSFLTTEYVRIELMEISEVSTFQEWLDAGIDVALSFSPQPSIVLAHLIDDGVLPLGKYLLRLSW